MVGRTDAARVDLLTRASAEATSYSQLPIWPALLVRLNEHSKNHPGICGCARLHGVQATESTR
eukprot:8921357-Lingulodinium_polyedra.AAC.1